MTTLFTSYKMKLKNVFVKHEIKLNLLWISFIIQDIQKYVN